MKTSLVVYVNSDDALLLWTVDALDDQTIGFAVERRLTQRGRRVQEFIYNWAPPGPAAHQIGERQRSDAWPFRCFSWTDHSVEPGDSVSYRVVPVLPGAPAVREDMASDWSDVRKVGTPRGATYQAYFNRGFVISQFMSRYLDKHYPGLDRDKALRKFKADIGAHLEDEVRAFLSGQIRTTMLGFLDGIAKGSGHLYAALFELGDEELVAALERLGPRAHLVLANGSIEIKKKNKKAVETTAQARERDENEDARKRLLAKGVEVEAHSRFVSPKPLAHNKFAVMTTAAGKPTSVWTGSTNWTTTGLCTQLNNGLLVKDADVARLYLDQWHALRDAGSAHPSELVTANDTPGPVGVDRPGKVRASVHFTRAHDRVDLAALGDIVMSANEGVLFLMFIPGASGALKNVLELADKKPKLLVRGVVSQLPEGRADEKTGKSTTLRVSVVGGPVPAMGRPRTVDVVQPEGMAHPAAGWAVETTRKQFLGDIGHAIIHSKVIVVDPFSKDPTVVTGSHNFSISASEDNDENFIVVRGDTALAEAYAVNVESAWRHYAGRIGNPHARLRGIDYLRALLADQRRQEKFWHLALSR
jgi:phosphatidylserine/phosphatidylglycerophosphate/cardiolipin synthase-like enzyme